MKIKYDKRLHVTMSPLLFERVIVEAKKNKVTTSQYVRECLMSRIMEDNLAEFDVKQVIAAYRELQ